jgi:predicted GNAT family acetyltransferase
LRFALIRDAQEFAARTERLLSARLECNVLATVLMRVLAGPHADPPPVFAIGVTEPGDEVAFAAMRTPPFPLLTSPLDDLADAEPLMELWRQADPECSSVTGVTGTARAIAAAWVRRTGGTTRTTMNEAMHVLDTVDDPPRPAAGALRLAEPDERDLLIEWMREFVAEAGLIGAAQAAGMVDARLRHQGLLVWDGGQPVSMIGVTPEVSGVVRIGPVYTPPPHRRRGYAGTAVAAASERRGALHAVHRPGQPDLEQDLRRGRLSPHG